MKKIAAVFLIIALLIPVFGLRAFSAEEGELGNLTWSFSDGTLTVSGYGEMADLTSYTDQPWRSLAASVKKLIISEGITSVGNNAFSLMPALSSIYLPKSLTRIGDASFEKCYALKLLDLPSSVKQIGNYAFSDCWQLKEADIALFASNLNKIGDYAFSGCYSLAKMTLPTSLAHIGEGAFAGCSALDGIDMPDKLTYLGRFAFQDCVSLTKINIPWQIKEVPDYAFFGCTSLKDVSFGRYLEKIGKEAFLWCASLKEIKLPASVTDISDRSIGYYYFSRNFIRYYGITIISASPAAMDYAVKNSINLIIDDSTHVCDNCCPYCFGCTVNCNYYTCYDKCTGHTFPITGSVSESITWSLSESLELKIEGTGDMPDFTYDTVPWRVYKDAIRKVTLSEGITSVGSYSFDSHYALREVTLPESVTKIGHKAFALCSALSGIDVKKVTSVGDLAFHGCTSLEYAHLGEDVTSIGRYSFYGCVNLIELKTGEMLESIGEAAFENCPMLERVYVPASVSFIGDYALGYTYSTGRYYYKNDNFTVSAPLFGEGQRYAEANGMNYERSDEHECASLCEVCGRCLDAECPYPECERKCDGICTATWDAPFTDVRESDWYYDSVRYVFLKGLFTGMTENTFAPSGSVTRAQLTVVLWRLAGSPEVTVKAPFEDLSAAWYRDAVSWAYASGVVTGKSATEFDPMGKITREQMVTMLMRFCDKIWGRDTSLRGDIDVFIDKAEISSYAEAPISWALAEGLLTGKDSAEGKLVSPLAASSRAECATIFARLLKK